MAGDVFTWIPGRCTGWGCREPAEARLEAGQVQGFRASPGKSLSAGPGLVAAATLKRS